LISSWRNAAIRPATKVPNRKPPKLQKQVEAACHAKSGRLARF
jgi:hypothetical protein